MMDSELAITTKKWTLKYHLSAQKPPEKKQIEC